MRFNQSIAHFFCFTILIFLLASPFLIGCGDSLPETATVKVEILSSPNPLTSVEPIAENNPNGPVCKAGDILRPGESCFYPGTDTAFSVLSDGTGYFSPENVHITVGEEIFIKGSTFNDQSYTLVASKRDDGFWEIKEVGESSELLSGELILIVSIDYDPEKEFPITQDFDRDFQLDPDWPGISLALSNGTVHTLSVRVTLLIDGEVDINEEDQLEPGASLQWERSWR